MDALWRDLGSKPGPALIALSVAGYAALAISPPGAAGVSLCGSLASVSLADLPLIAPDSRQLATVAMAWLAMVVAMMPLLVVQPVRHAMHSSTAGRCKIAACTVLAGYLGVWMAVGLLMVPVAAVLHAIASSVLCLALLALALGWSASPIGVRAHNACHRRMPLAASGPTANRDCLLLGIRTGLACATACWPWMLVPFGLAAQWHLPAMAAIGLFLFIERSGPTLRPAWRLPYALRLVLHRKPLKTLGSA